MTQKKEKLYQPFVEAENVRRLYMLKELTGRPMTELINEAIQHYDIYLREELEDEVKYDGEQND